MSSPEPSRRLRGEPLRRLQTYVLDRRSFNEMRTRLPRAVRRDVEPAPEGHVGVILQATTGEQDRTPLATLYGTAPESLAHERIRELERRLIDLLG